MEPNQRLCGMEIASCLKLTNEQYKRAIERVNPLDSANELVKILLDFKQAEEASHEQPTDGPQEATESIVRQAECDDNSLDLMINVSAQADLGGDRRKASTTKSCETNTTNSSPCSSSLFASSTTSLSTETTTTSGCISSENQSLDYLGSNRPPHINYLNNNQLISQQYHAQQQRHKLQRSSSHQPSSSAHATGDLRLIYIDGSNVAWTHGKNLVFSWIGIKLCAEYFKRRNHRVKVFLPEDKCVVNVNTPDAICIMNYLNHFDALIKTPIGCSDDMFLIEAARQKNGVIVSNDLFRNEKRLSNNELKRYISLHRLPYIFDDDHFIPASDPLGRAGPSLNEFLRCDYQASSISQQVHRQSVYRTKSHQRQ